MLKTIAKPAAARVFYQQGGVETNGTFPQSVLQEKHHPVFHRILLHNSQSLWKIFRMQKAYGCHSLLSIFASIWRMVSWRGLVESDRASSILVTE